MKKSPPESTTCVTSIFRPHLEILPPPQRRLWNELECVPNTFVLYGGTAVLARGGADLATALAAAGHIYGTAFNPQITLKALSFFSDGDLPTLPPDVCRRLSVAVRRVDLDRLPRLGQLS